MVKKIDNYNNQLLAKNKENRTLLTIGNHKYGYMTLSEERQKDPYWQRRKIEHDKWTDGEITRINFLKNSFGEKFTEKEVRKHVRPQHEIEWEMKGIENEIDNYWKEKDDRELEWMKKFNLEKDRTKQEKLMEEQKNQENSKEAREKWENYLRNKEHYELLEWELFLAKKFLIFR